MNGIEENDRRRAPEGGLAAEEFIKDDTQTVLVAGRLRIASLARGLLGGHVTGRAQDGAVLRHLLGRVEPMRQPEIHEVGLAIGVEHGIGRLDVAMNDPLVVSVHQGLCQVAYDHGCCS